MGRLSSRRIAHGDHETNAGLGHRLALVSGFGSIFSYEEPQRRELLQALPYTQAEEQVVAALEEYAGWYLCIIRSKQMSNRPTPSESATQLKELESALKRVLLLVEDLYPDTRLRLFESDPNASIYDDLILIEPVLARMRRRALAALPVKIRRGARPKNRARRTWVGYLRDLWVRCGNPEPGRRIDWNYYNSYSPFFDFVKAAMEPVDAPALTGLDGVIRAALREEYPITKTY